LPAAGITPKVEVELNTTDFLPAGPVTGELRLSWYE
jgi:hypothetical protein